MPFYITLFAYIKRAFAIKRPIFYNGPERYYVVFILLIL